MDKCLTQNNTQRSVVIDIIKGITIILVVWGHCLQYCNVGNFDFFELKMFKFIYSFHMPLFSLISGFLTGKSINNHSINEVFKSRTKSLLWPMFVFNVVGYYCNYAIENIAQRKWGLLISGSWLGNMGGSWFLWSMFACTLAVLLSSKLAKSVNNRTVILQIFCLVFLSVLVVVFPNYELTLFVYPYFCIGYFFCNINIKRKFCFSERSKFLSWVIASFAFFALLFVFRKDHYIYTTGLLGGESLADSILIDAFRWLIGLVGSLWLIISVVVFEKNIIRFSLLTKLLIWAGKHSLEIYLLSGLIINEKIRNCFTSVFSELYLSVTKEIVYSILFTPVIAAIVLALCWCCIKLINKMKISEYIFGR